MFVDFRDLESGVQIQTGICIIGAGAAGITLARSLIKSGIDVCLLESGGFDSDENIQSLYDGESTGLSFTGVPAGCRLRYFGGTTNHWNGWCSPLGEIDFKVRPWVQHSGWPLQKIELDPYYEKASKVCELGPYRYDIESIKDKAHKFPAFFESKFHLGLWQIGPPTRFGQKYRDELEAADNINVYLHANVIELVSNESASALLSVKIQTLEGKKGTVRAQYFVLACGGIENARMLLLSDRVEQWGLGNNTGLVGRYFMQHIELNNLHKIMLNNPSSVIALFEKFQKWNTFVKPAIVLSDFAQEQHKLLNCAYSLQGVWQDTGYSELAEIWNELKQCDWPDDFFTKLQNVIIDLDSVVAAIYNKIHGKAYHGHGEELFSHKLTLLCEQSPNPDSRVTLTDARDQLGLKKVKVDWRLTEVDKTTILKSSRLIGEEFGRLGLGRVNIPEFLLTEETDWPQPIWGGCHHMGTTKMSENPNNGVVDKNCLVHSLNNLYIAGSSVFPTVGYTMPTLTIVALALRLGDHLKNKFSA